MAGNRFRIGSVVRISGGCDSEGRIGKIVGKDKMDNTYCVKFFEPNEDGEDTEWFTTMWFRRV